MRQVKYPIIFHGALAAFLLRPGLEDQCDGQRFFYFSGRPACYFKGLD